MLLRNVLIGLPTMALCLLLQSMLMAAAFRYYARHERQLQSQSFFSTIAVITSVMLLLLLGNIAQLTIWGVLFRLLGEFTDLREAIYHSAVNFATLGYGDIVMSEKHRLLGPLEAINGVLMIGVSTAALMTTFEDGLTKLREARRGSREKT